ncbi:MAG: hypothetical protein J6A24_00810 [Clostridia bacterium]|nr:hypothetical protein [Clostridia bacterium]
MKASASPFGKYNNSRLSILLLFIFSVINIFTISTLGTYFLFSAYLPQVLISLAYLDPSLTPVMVILSILYILPYLLCYIFSKKKAGWMVAALVLFSVDSLFFLIDLFAYLAAGDLSFIIDLIFRIYVLASLIIGVVNRKQAVSVANGVQENAANENVNQGSETEGNVDFYDTTRQLTVHRKKKFVGCAVAILVYANGKELGKLKSGQTETFTVPARTFHLRVAFSNGLSDNSIEIAAGESPIAYEVVPKMGFTANVLELNPLQ